MTAQETIVHLLPSFFGKAERVLVEHGPLSASTFSFASGVAGLRLSNEHGHVVVLPYQGQQVWSAEFGGRNLTMKSMFPEPRPTQEFLATFGAFLVHCGATAVGGPGPGDRHPLHGELPNAPYQSAFVTTGSDEGGEFVGVGGAYRHTVAFSFDYLAEPLLKLYAGSTLFSLGMTITNLKNSPMDLLYLAHANFKPVDNGRLVYSAACTPEHTRVRRSVPSHIKPAAGYVEFIEELSHDPARANVLEPGLAFDPEIVFFLDYQADRDGWAHTMQVLPDGSADYLAHRPGQLPKGTRWMCRTADQDALGFEPGITEPEGYAAEKAKGNVMVLPAKGVFHCDMRIGALAPDQAREAEERINRILSDA